MEEDKPVHKRRPRYKGRNPRKFEERYKEHNPEKYAQDVEHIISKGNTPVGTHRPICVQEILEILDPQPGCVILDATLGYGGHTEQLLKAVVPGGRVLGVDADPIELPKTQARLLALGFEEDTFSARPMNFAGIGGLVYETQGGFDGILADLGVSSMQLDNPSRGFSHKTDGPLDLRLNPNKGQPAWEFLGPLSTDAVEQILVDNGDETQARVVAKAIKASDLKNTTTKQLATEIIGRLKNVRPSLSESEIKKSLQRSFMALRIAVNKEFEVLDKFLKALPKCLKPGAKVAILTFHSGEDRRVKKAFKEGKRLGLYSEVVRNPIRPSAEECRSNPRSSCAKLRWAQRSEVPVGY